MLLSPQLLAQLERLALVTRRRVSGVYPGEHRSRRLGTSTDFADWRPYTSGDDFRRIDYQILARHDRLVVRLFEAEDELVVRVVLDASSSMDFENKFELASQIAAATCYVAACRRNRVRVVIAGEDVAISPWAGSPDSALVLMKWIEQRRPGGKTKVAQALSSPASSSGRAGLTLIISDLLSDEWEQIIRHFGPGSTALIHLLSPTELEPELRGDLLLVDSEHQGSLDVSLSARAIREYKDRLNRWLSAVRTSSTRRGATYVKVTSDESIESLLLRRLPAEGILV